MDTTPIKHNPSSILSSLSLQSWWEKANDEVQYSYSKLSQLSPTTHKIEAEQYLNPNYPCSTLDHYNPKQDIPRSLTRNSSQSTKQHYSQGYEDLYSMIQDLNKRINQDQLIIQELQRRITEKDNLIFKLQEFTKTNF